MVLPYVSTLMWTAANQASITGLNFGCKGQLANVRVTLSMSVLSVANKAGALLDVRLDPMDQQ